MAGDHLHFANKDKIASVFNYAEKLSKIKSEDKKQLTSKNEFGIVKNDSKMDYSIANTKKAQNLKSSNEQESKIMKNSPSLYNSCNLKKKANKRTTIEIINDID